METIPFEIAETAHAMRKAFDRRAAGMGVTRAQWKVLFRLTRQPGLRQIELADMLDIEPITLSRIIDRLAEAELVERRADPADRRAWRLYVTKKAEPLVKRLRAVAEEMTGDAFEGVGREDIETMRRVLARVRENVSRNAAFSKASNE
ncbi:MAG TPA: MarR family transcriptional regulator [Sphingomicrobium sp.]|jgi:DNA-binding MarR family transcriptional regulator